MNRKITFTLILIVLFVTLILIYTHEYSYNVHPNRLTWKTIKVADLAGLDTAFYYLDNHSGFNRPITLVWKELTINDSIQQKHNNRQ